jgi:hypothetical protein
MTITMKKVHATVTVHLYVDVEEGISLNDVVNELDYHFADTTDMARIVDTHISDFDIVEEE